MCVKYRNGNRRQDTCTLQTSTPSVEYGYSLSGPHEVLRTGPSEYPSCRRRGLRHTQGRDRTQCPKTGYSGGVLREDPVDSVSRTGGPGTEHTERS